MIGNNIWKLFDKERKKEKIEFYSKLLLRAGNWLPIRRVAERMCGEANSGMGPSAGLRVDLTFMAQNVQRG